MQETLSCCHDYRVVDLQEYIIKINLKNILIEYKYRPCKTMMNKIVPLLL